MSTETNGHIDGVTADATKGTNRLPKEKGKSKAKRSGMLGFIERTGKRTGKKTTTFVGADDEATSSVTVKSFPGFDAESVIATAVESGASLAWKLTAKIGGKTVTGKGTFEGEDAGEMVEDFFGLELNDE